MRTAAEALNVDVFSYLSVLISIVIGLGMSHLLQASVHIIRDRTTTKLYAPTLLWTVNFLLLFTLVWWSDFSLNEHKVWTFAQFLAALAVPAVLYVAAGLIMPASGGFAPHDMRRTYFANRRWTFSLVALAIALSFVQTLLLDGRVALNEDSGLKAVFLAVALLPIVTDSDRAQYAAAILDVICLFAFISLLFSNLRM